MSDFKLQKQREVEKRHPENQKIKGEHFLGGNVPILRSRLSALSAENDLLRGQKKTTAALRATMADLIFTHSEPVQP